MEEYKYNLTRNVEALVRTMPDVVREDNTINYRRAAVALDLYPETLWKILNDKSGQARPKTEEKFCKYFGVSKSALYGDELPAYVTGEKPLTAAERVMQGFQGLSRQDQLKVAANMPKEIIDFLKGE